MLQGRIKSPAASEEFYKHDIKMKGMYEFCFYKDHTRLIMKNTTLCYIENAGRYLMLYRNKKEADENAGKWIGIGGHFEEGESPDECMLREVREESGLVITDYRFRAVITFVSDEYETEYMFLYTAKADSEEITECDEGELRWIDKESIMELNLWEGDRIFLKELLDEGRTEERFFTLKLEYSKGRLIDSSIRYIYTLY